MELFLLAHEKYHEWGAFGKCTSLYEFVSSSIGTGLTDTNTDIRGQETASSIGTGLTNTNTDIRGQETAAPNLEDDILSFLDDALQR